MRTIPDHPGHNFMSRSGLGEHWAGCECGEEFSWDTREEEHREHVSSVIWWAGYSAGNLDGYFGTYGSEKNPYLKEGS